MEADKRTSLFALVVDDNQHMRHIILSLLRAAGVKNITEASDGADALMHLQVRDFDFVLADINMHPIDGIEFTRMVRRSRDTRTPQVPIIMVTGHTARARIEEARDAGITEFVAKPITARTLIQRIEAVISRPRPFINTATYIGPDRRRARPREDYSGPRRRASDTPVGT